ncbi:hypothetical protein I4U23_017878 [Adineta vaga]|nr:hypothetical protein I4U23_017878 [Adineta vaga]
MPDYYKELGIHRHANSTEIRAAYKRLALLWHPDRNKAKEAEDKFKKIKQAYDILIDDNQRREYDQQQQQQRPNSWFDGPSNFTYAHSTVGGDQFNLHTFDQFMSAPVDPFEIINDIQYFQDSDFTAKMMNSPSYRNLYAQIFNTMNNDPQSHRRTRTSSPIYVNNDRLFRPISKGRSKRTSSKRFSTNIPVIHSTMPNDWLLNELIDTYEQQNIVFMQPSFHTDPFFDELTHCTLCQKKTHGDRTQLIHHEHQCRENYHHYTTIPPTTSVRV